MARQRTDLVIVGHLAFNRDKTCAGEQTSFGGGALYSAVGASLVSDVFVGVVARVGKQDGGLQLVRILKERLGVNTDGVGVVPSGATARFAQVQYPDGHRAFRTQPGVSDHIDPKQFPESYLTCRHIHFPTAPPAQYLRWIGALRKRLGTSVTISVDAFEAYARVYPDETKRAFELSDLVFLNEEEAEILGGIDTIRRTTACVLKRGPRGAVFMDEKQTIPANAPKVKSVDTTGAGDVLAGVFLALRLRQIPIKTSLQKAVSIASRSVTRFGVEHIFPDRQAI